MLQARVVAAVSASLQAAWTAKGPEAAAAAILTDAVAAAAGCIDG